VTRNEEEEAMSEKTVDMVVSEDVCAFAREQGVEAYLPVVLQTARHVFPEAEVTMELDPDPEIEDLCHVLVVVQGVRASVEQALERKTEYQQRLFAGVPAPRVVYFRLRLRLAP
jgi:hypothetical protein